MSTLILLVGPKGSGKSHVGRILESRLGVHSFHVEPLWMAYYARCQAAGKQPTVTEGIQQVHPLIEEALRQHDPMCVETTGASEKILSDLLRLGFNANVFVARVRAPMEVCLERISRRDQTNQIQMDPESVREMFRLSEAVDLRWDLVIENTGLTEEQIVKLFREGLVHQFRLGRT